MKKGFGWNEHQHHLPPSGSWGEADSGLSKNVMFLLGRPMSDPTAPLAGLGLPAHHFQVDGFAQGPCRVPAAAQVRCRHHVAESAPWD